MTKKGIDISYWQGAVDFQKVKNSGIEFAILRAGYRFTTDERFYSYVKGAQQSGIEVMGIYWFSYALNVDQAKQEGAMAVEHAKNAGLDPKKITIFFDFEYDTVNKAKAKGVHLGKNECIAHTRAFCDEVERLGYTAGVYANPDYVKNMYDTTTLDKYVFWLADWTGEPDYPCAFHQYSSTGVVPGISTNVDMNYFYGFKMEDKQPITTGVTAEKVLNVARSWLGYSEANGKFREILNVYNSHKPLARGYTIQPWDEWCDAFISAVAIKAGAVHLIGTEVGVERHTDIFKDKGIWIEDGRTRPMPGDIIVFNWDDSTHPNTGWADHIGFVEQVYGNTIVCLEGNLNEVVARRTINVGWGYIRGFARPRYDSASITPVVPPKKSVDEVAKEVLKGSWGNGGERKTALEKAGYSYEEVQSRVNQLISGDTNSIPEIAKEVIAGKWGNGDQRRDALETAGYNYSQVQSEVNKLLSLKPIVTIAKEVIRGAWGNGEDRKNALKRAGYDYDTVQAKVNELLRTSP